MQKCHTWRSGVVESGDEHRQDSAEEFRQLDTAAGQLAEASIEGAPASDTSPDAGNQAG